MIWLTSILSWCDFRLTLFFWESCLTNRILQRARWKEFWQTKPKCGRFNKPKNLSFFERKTFLCLLLVSVWNMFDPGASCHVANLIILTRSVWVFSAENLHNFVVHFLFFFPFQPLKPSLIIHPENQIKQTKNPLSVNRKKPSRRVFVTLDCYKKIRKKWEQIMWWWLPHSPTHNSLPLMTLTSLL